MCIRDRGMHEIIVRLHPEVSVEVTVNVARSEEEAITQIEELAPEDVAVDKLTQENDTQDDVAEKKET